MPICHQGLLGKKLKQRQTTSGWRLSAAGDDLSSSAAMTSATDDHAPWKGVNSSVTLSTLLNVTLHSSLPLANVSGNGSWSGGDGEGMAGGGPFDRVVTNNSLFIKIVLLLILTAVVLLSTYKFVVRLFSGYSEKKDDSSDFYIGIHDD